MGGTIAIDETASAPSPPAFEDLVAAHRQRVFRFALASLRDRDAAESVAQECFVRAWQAWSTFRGDAPVQAWLMRIAVNLIRDTARSRRFQFWRRADSADLLSDARFIPDTGSSAEQQLIAHEQVQAVWKAVDRLSHMQRTVFLLRFMEEMNLSEIEAATGASNAAVRVHLHEAVHAVRKRIRRAR